MKRLLSQMISAGLGLWIATMFIAGATVSTLPNSNFFGFAITAQWQLFILFGTILGLLNFFVKPVLNIITLPLRIITLGLFSIVTQAALIWVLDIMFPELSIPLFYPLLWTTLIIWVANLLLSKSILKEQEY